MSLKSKYLVYREYPRIVIVTIGNWSKKALVWNSYDFMEGTHIGFKNGFDVSKSIENYSDSNKKTYHFYESDFNDFEPYFIG